MPVEIRELIIRALVGEQIPDAGKDKTARPYTASDLAEEREAIIQDCVREVIQILKREEER